MRNLIFKMAGWRKSKDSTYAECHKLFGGSVITHPDVLNFLHNRLPCNPDYYVKKDTDGRLLGALCTWDGKHLAGDAEFSKKIANAYPFSKDEIILPISSSEEYVIPFKSKYLSPINAQNVINSMISINSGRRICIAKGCGGSGYSSKTKNRRNSELNRFLNAGGDIFDQSEFSPEDLCEIYIELFYKRRGCKPDNVHEMLDALKNLRSFFFGHVLTLKGKPCAFQMITKAESPGWVSYDYINGGYDQIHDSFCPGTVVTWLNVKKAYDFSSMAGKELRYSFGKPTADYKERWCRTESLARLL